MKNRLWLKFVVDILCGAILLGIFYLVNYVIPKEYKPEESIKSEENIAVKEEGYFSDNIIIKDDSYTSNNIALNITTVNTTINNKKVVYYVADIRLKDVNSLQSVFAEDKFGIGYRETVLSMATRSKAILAVNGDYYGLSKSGVVIRNGVIYRESTDENDVLVLYYDGTMEAFKKEDFDIDEVKAKEPYQVWTFGPSLLDENGKALTSFPAYSKILYSNPRTSIGYFESGHYVIIIADGRSEASGGLTMKELAKVYEDLGCKVAYNLDGGKSTVMAFNGKVFNVPDHGGRKSSDTIIIKEVE